MTWIADLLEYIGRATGASAPPEPLSQTPEIADLAQSRIEMNAATSLLKDGYRVQLADMERRMVIGGRR